MSIAKSYILMSYQLNMELIDKYSRECNFSVSFPSMSKQAAQLSRKVWGSFSYIGRLASVYQDQILFVHITALCKVFEAVWVFIV